MKKSLVFIVVTAHLLLVSTQAFALENAAVAKFDDFLEYKELPKKIHDSIADQDVSFGADLANIDLINGINLSTKYHYDVEASYLDKYYTRIDKWDLKLGINVGDVLNNFIELPFSFSVERNNSFYFVRQFHTKKEAMKAMPYAPNKLPLNAKLALKNMKTGDFVSMPANLNVAVSAEVKSSMVAPIIVSADAKAEFLLSGEFTVQVFKMDETHVRLKLITKRGRDTSAVAGIGANFSFFGIHVLDHQIDRLFERDFTQFGYSYNPGSQFIIDYVFDLKSPEAQVAYNHILNSTLKFKDLIVADMINAQDLKDKLISTYEKADELFLADQKLDVKDRRVQRVFKGFNSYQGQTKHIKFSFLVTSYTNDRTFTESKVTFVDKNDKNMTFYYPTYSRYIESHFGKWIFDLKDQTFQTNFGLIPRFNAEDIHIKNPDLGLTFERKDRYFTAYEQKVVEKFMLSQIPATLARDIDFSQWKDGTKKIDSRIFFQLVLKSQGFDYLKNRSGTELREKIVAYVAEKRKMHVIDENPNQPQFDKIQNFLLLNRFIEKDRLESLADSLAKILRNDENDSEIMTKKLVALNDGGVFDKIGIGFLISLLPEDKLQDLVYLKLDMIGKDLTPIDKESGTLNYHALYKELNEVQSRLSNRSYDLRLSDEDTTMENSENIELN
jgi:hypothetical protein